MLALVKAAIHPRMNSRHPLSIAHVTAERGFSGGEVQVFLLMEGLRKRGHRNLLLCPPGSRSEQEARRRGLEATAVHARNHWSPRGVMSIARRLRETAPDLVHLHSGRATWLGGIAAWLLWTTIHIAFIVSLRNRIRVLLGWAFNWLIGSRDARLIVGDAQLDIKTPLGPGFEAIDPSEHRNVGAPDPPSEIP